jgi:hypothetical protein
MIAQAQVLCGVPIRIKRAAPSSADPRLDTRDPGEFQQGYRLSGYLCVSEEVDVGGGGVSNSNQIERERICQPSPKYHATVSSNCSLLCSCAPAASLIHSLTHSLLHAPAARDLARVV